MHSVPSQIQIRCGLEKMKPEVSVSDQLALAVFPASLSLLQSPHYISMNASGDVVEGALALLHQQTQTTLRSRSPYRPSWIDLS